MDIVCFLSGEALCVESSANFLYSYLLCTLSTVLSGLIKSFRRWKL